MNTIPKTWQKSLFTLITGLSLLINTNSAQSQIIPDHTLGNENSKFTPTGVKNLIEGGAIRGNNLFHSFSEFNVNNNQQVYFTNPTGINNILTRVTGNNISNIFGTLGVDGNANLFLINPHGIIFGKDAKLDVKGSFLASTAPMIKFADNTVFSAKDTSANSLLTMSVPVGIQWGNNPTGDIMNNGNLTVGKDLTLSGRNLNIKEATLQTGGNLILEGQEKVTINDTVNNPVILKSAGNITIQGTQSIEINALNHNDSNITSDRDIIFRSPVRLLSNGIYTVGGYFVTEDLNENVIDFIIPHNNIIKVNGDVTLEDYDGSSLYILASGKVTLGNVTINNVDNQPITQTIADGKGGNQTVRINSKNDVGILDVRAGIDANKLSGILENNRGLPTNADIQIGNIINSGGTVVLTNQYKPNSQLPSANITVGNINTSTSDEKNGGAIALTTTQGNITTQVLDSSSHSYSGNAGSGGAIALSTTGGNITTEDLNSSSRSWSGNTDNGGAIILRIGDANALNTTQGNITTGDLNSISYSLSGNTGNGGAIILRIGDVNALNTTQGNITTQNLYSVSYSPSGNTGTGGAIALNTFQGNITTQDLYSVSYSPSGNAATGGAIALLTTGGNITVQDIFSFSYSPSGNAATGGAINLQALEGDIMGKSLNSFSISEKGKAGTGGNVTLVAKNNISNLGILTLSSDSKSGTVELTGFGDLSLTNTKIITSKQVTIKNPITGEDIILNLTGIGQSGDVKITGLGNLIINKSNIESDTKGIDPAGNVTITSPGFLTFNQSYIKSDTNGTGQAGSITIKANQGINLTDAQCHLSAKTNNQGKAGNITIETPILILKNGANITTSTTDKGQAGDINIKVKDSINLSDANTGFFANTAPNSTGNGGNIKIDPITMIIENGAKIAVNSEGTGIGGNIFLQADNLKLNNGFINAETVNSNGGGITLQIGNYLLLANNSQITSTAGTAQSGGNGGNVQINAPFIIGLATNPKHQITANAFSGKGGNILINTNGIFGTQYIDIQASSQSGPQGLVEINTPGINPANGLTQLPSIPIDLSALINNSCQVAKRNSFTVAGKGGLTPTPDQTLLVNSIVSDWGNSANIPQKSALISGNTLQKEKTNQPQEIREAQGFIKDEKGNIILTSQPLQVTVNGVYLHPLDCERLLSNP